MIDVQNKLNRGVPLQAEQADWLADTDKDIDEQELVQNHDESNVYDNVRRHSEQPESINNTYVLEKDDSNVTPDSSNICTNDNQVDQNAAECVDERAALANLTLDTEENKTILKQLKKANASLTQELEKCKTNLDETNSALGEAISCRDSCLIALQNKQNEFEKYKAFNDRTIDYEILQTKLNETLGLLALKDIEIKEGLKTKAYEISVLNQKHDELVKKSLLTKSQLEGYLKENTKVISDLKVKEEKDIDKMIEMDKQLKFLNEIVYTRNQSIQTIHMLAPKCATYNGRLTFANPRYLKKAQSEKPCLYEIPFDTSDPANRFAPEREETMTLDNESRSKLNKDYVKPYDYTKQNSLYEIFKAPSLEYLYQLERGKEAHISDTQAGGTHGCLRLGDTFPHAFTSGTLHDPATGAWNMDTDFMTRRVLLQCDSTGDFYPITAPSPIPHAFLKPPVLCHACQLGKHVRLPFVSSNTIVTSCFDIIHSDVWTSPIPSLSGFKYYVLFLDHYSRFVWVYPLLHKSDVFSKFVLFRTYVRTQFKCEIRSFQCDHGGEFDNRNLHKLFADNGIQFCFSCPKISQQNDGTLSRYKARLVANGSTQLEGVDVDETFSPVVKPGTIRTVLSLVASRHWPIHRLDVKNAFLHGDLSKTVYMHQPPGFRDYVHPDYVCLLQRTLYGLKQAPELGFSGTDIAYLLLYVDDIVLTASSEILLQQIIRSLHQEFAMIDLGLLNYFLGISVIHDSSGLFLSPKKYAIEILEKAHMVNCSLQYLRFTRPDISYTVQQLFSSSTTYLVSYSDTDWAGYPTTRRSTSGYCVFLGNNLLSWSSNRQPTLSRSSVDAEYRGVANVVAKTCCAVYLSCNPVQHQRTKHIKIDILFVRDLVATGQVQVLHVPSRYQFADIFTKDCHQLYLKNFALV
ncbi:ribonuclease H-like domain-containing protein [Tanacetum coccineum]